MSSVPTVKVMMAPEGDNKAEVKEFRLGRVRPKARPQVLRFAAYLDDNKASSQVPPSVDYSQKAMNAIRNVYLNDRYGDCVIAGKYHQLGIWSGNDSGTAVIAQDQEVYNQYQMICGPGDNGCIITRVLDVMQQNGLPCNGKLHKIDGYVAVDWTNQTEVKVALYLFGSLTIGINLPKAWQCTNCTWDVNNTQIIGGHDVCCVGYNDTGVQICTWGAINTITWAAFTSKNWLEECYASLAPDWYGNDNLAPCGVDTATLKADLVKIGGGTIPPIDPVPPTPPVTPPVPPANQFPNYNISLSGNFPTGMGRHQQVTMTGTAVPQSSEPFPFKGPKDGIDYPQLMMDLLKLWADYKKHDISGMITDLEALLNELKSSKSEHKDESQSV